MWPFRGKKKLALLEAPRYNLLHQLQQEFGIGLSDLSMEGGNYSMKGGRYGIRVKLWREGKDGEWEDNPLDVVARGDDIPEAVEVLKTKLRLLA